MSSISGKIVLITGGASGIGKLMGERVLKEGAKQLVIWDIDKTNLDKTSEEFKTQNFNVLSYLIDISNTESVIETARKVKEDAGTIDILINNAGVVVGKNFVEHTHNDIAFTMSINADAMMHITLEFLPDMIKKGSGHIVNIASAAGYVGNPKMSVYSASKWAALGWSESLRIELEKTGKDLHVTTVTPYYINTGMFDGVKTNFLLPMLNPGKVTDAIIKAIKSNNLFVRKPFLIKLTPFVKGILPARAFDWFGGKFLGVYSTMNTFTGREKKNNG